MKIVLASKSAARAQILRNAGVSVEIRSAGVDEGPLKAAALASGATPRQVAESLAEAKAVAASRGTGDWTIGADQTLEFEGRLFDKAQSVDEAHDYLRLMRGKTHQLHAAPPIV